MSTHFEMTFALLELLASGSISTVEMTRYDTALNCSIVATTEAASGRGSCPDGTTLTPGTGVVAPA